MSDVNISAPVNVEGPVEKPGTGFGKIKLAFLYLLIAGLAASAITAVIALLLNDFNSAIQKALLTILIFFSQSLIILLLVWTDRNNTIGKAILPTTVAALAFANMITTTLGTWEVISNELAWRFVGLYFLVLGIAFILVGISKLRIQTPTVKYLLITTAGLLVLWGVALIPWVLNLFGDLDPFYFRVVGAVTILITAAFLITLTLRGIALAQRPELRIIAATPKPTTSGGLLAIIITLGVIASIIWCVGFMAFLVSSVQSANPPRQTRGDYYTLNQ